MKLWFLYGEFLSHNITYQVQVDRCGLLNLWYLWRSCCWEWL